jgi:hypothetical protein
MVLSASIHALRVGSSRKNENEQVQMVDLPKKP